MVCILIKVTETLHFSRPDTMDRINDLFPDTEEGIAARDFCMEIIVSLLI